MPGEADDLGQLIRTPAYDQAIAGGETAARLLGHRYLMPEHMVLAVLLDPSSLPSQILEGPDRQRLITELRKAMSEGEYSEDPSEPPPEDDAYRSGPPEPDR